MVDLKREGARWDAEQEGAGEGWWVVGGGMAPSLALLAAIGALWGGVGVRWGGSRAPTVLASHSPLLGWTRERLKQACRDEGLRVSGTKAELSDRLLQHLAVKEGDRREQELVADQPSPPARNGRVAPPPARPRQPAPTAEEILQTASGADMELVVLGSGACSPSPIRSASSVALRLRDSYWLFDAGEGTQIQMQRCFVSPSRIDRIFVTHSHGDHCFGLPGLLCLIARGRDQSAPPMEIYGPAGIRAFLRVTLRFSGTTFLPRYVVHELHGIPFLHSRRPQPKPLSVSGEDVAASDFGEQPGGRNIVPEPDGTWALLSTPFGEEGRLTVRAAPVRHSAPTVGYVVEEDAKRGRLRPDAVLPLLERNRHRLRDEWGVHDPRSLFKKIKLLGPGEQIELPDGAVIRAEDAIGATRRGRKVALMGDCCDASPCAQIAQGADILVHEATNAYLPQFGDRGGYSKLERETFAHGHSTPQMAGRIAKAFGARALMLNHFSQRYSPDAVGMMRAIHGAAVTQSGLEPDRVITARDTLVVPVWQPDREKPLQPFLHANRPAPEALESQQEVVAQ